MANEDDRQSNDSGPGRDPRGAGQGAPPAADVHAYIGRQLRAVYDDVAKQPVPDRFLELMKQLETAQTDN